MALLDSPLLIAVVVALIAALPPAWFAWQARAAAVTAAKLAAATARKAEEVRVLVNGTSDELRTKLDAANHRIEQLTALLADREN